MGASARRSPPGNGPMAKERTDRKPPDDWATPAEQAEYRETPDYAETVAYLERLAAAHPSQLRLEGFGRSGEGRELRIAIASKAGIFSPEAARASGRAVLLVQNAIHAGEMDGKDACLALLRDLLREPRAGALLDRVVLVVIPVYNVDGHERRSPFQRINQNGPDLVGWRANATNLNLNRDYLKADAPETRAFLRLFHRWLPDFFVDNHVTDGADFRYDVTFDLCTTPDVFPPTADWLRDPVIPELVRKVEASGHPTYPGAVFLKDDSDPLRGLVFNENPPRFSTGQMILEGRPGLLVELHMLKPYRTRVLGDYAVLRALLERLNEDAARLIELNRRADEAAVALGAPSARGTAFPLVVEASGEITPVLFRGFRFVRYPGPVSGATVVRYTAEPEDYTIPVETGARVGRSVALCAGYIVPPQWARVIEVLEAHGVALRRTTRAWTGEVGLYRCAGMRWAGRPFEGHHPILRGGNVESEMGQFGTVTLSRETATFPAGSVVASLAQRLSRVVLHWLEPEAPDSALRWGFFAPVFERRESPEAYVVERLAAEGALVAPGVRQEFEARLRSDPSFAADPSARIDYLFDRSPWGAANRVGEYPVGRLESLEGLPLG
jgi:hypothetical protein